MNHCRYQVGGSLASNAPTYVEREADKKLYTTLQAGEFCYVLDSRQMGKSSVLVKTSHRLQREGGKCTIVDLTNIGSENITPLQWYKGLVADILSGLKLSQKINLKSWWQEQDDISLLQKLSRFISEVILVELPHENIYIFLDEIDSILCLDFPVDDFFALIRFCYNQRAINPEYYRLTFALFGVATPSDLIQDKRRTPFNIGKSIELGGLTLDQIQPLAEELELSGISTNKQLLFTEILYWTGGQPFLTQKLCQLLVNNPQDVESINIWVENTVKSYIIDKWESQDEPQHLRTISDRILSNEQMAGRLLGIYQQILMGIDVAADDSREQIELLLSGLIVNRERKLQVKNPIYSSVFNLEWVAKQIANLRPYGIKLKAWMASQQQDNFYLLKGKELQEALAWSYEKQLSDQDYRFLTQSQELAKKTIEKDLLAEKKAREIERSKAQFALNAAQKAHTILADARKIARKKARTLRLSKFWILSVTFGVAGTVIILRLAGLFQVMELTMLDRFFQLRPPSEIDSRILIVAIDEPDIREIGKYPISDKILANTLQILKRHSPKAIGLDLYRDLPVEPGYKELVEIFKTTPNLIGIEKVIGSKVAPPPVLAELGQVGLADHVLDGDGKVRRALLSIRNDNGKLSYNLGLLLALQYLKTKGITPQELSNSEIRLGKAAFVAFAPDDGGYAGADDGGYQILLNYQGMEEQFHIVSIRDLLANRVSPNLIRDRIVFIGAIAESLNDLFQTPYSSHIFENPKQMAGVTVHANITSHILSSALDGRPTLQVWPEKIEWLWILLWSGTGAMLSWYYKSPSKLVLIVMVAGTALFTIAYLAFLQGYWIPIIPPIIGLIFTTTGLPIVITKKSEIIELRQVVKILVAVTEKEHTAGCIAIEYLKQSESPENYRLIERVLEDEKFL